MTDDQDAHAQAHRAAHQSLWPDPFIARPIVVYTRWYDRLHALVSPAKRRRLRLANALADMTLAEAQERMNAHFASHLRSL